MDYLSDKNYLLTPKLEADKLDTDIFSKITRSSIILEL